MQFSHPCFLNCRSVDLQSNQWIWLHPPDQNLGHTSTVFIVNPLPTPCNWDHMSTVSMVTPHSRPCLWVHTSTASRVTPPARSCTQGLMSTVSRVTPLPDSEPGVTCPQSLGWQHLPVPPSEVKFPQSPGLPPPRPCTCRHISTVSRVILHSRTFSWGHTSSLHGETLPQALYLGSHMHSLKGDTPPHILHQWSHVQSPG